MSSSQALRCTRSRYTYLSKDTLRLSSFSENYFLADYGLVIIDEKEKKKKEKCENKNDVSDCALIDLAESVDTFSWYVCATYVRGLCKRKEQERKRKNGRSDNRSRNGVTRAKRTKSVTRHDNTEGSVYSF